MGDRASFASQREGSISGDGKKSVFSGMRSLFARGGGGGQPPQAPQPSQSFSEADLNFHRANGSGTVIVPRANTVSSPSIGGFYANAPGPVTFNQASQQQHPPLPGPGSVGPLGAYSPHGVPTYVPTRENSFDSPVQPPNQFQYNSSHHNHPAPATHFPERMSSISQPSYSTGQVSSPPSYAPASLVQLHHHNFANPETSSLSSTGSLPPGPPDSAVLHHPHYASVRSPLAHPLDTHSLRNDSHDTSTSSANPHSGASHASPTRPSAYLPPTPIVPKPPATLFEQGVHLLSADGGQNANQAYAKFDQALRRLLASASSTAAGSSSSAVASSEYSWYTHALLLNNMAVARRQTSQFDDALVKIQEAWKVAVGAVVEEKKKLMRDGVDVGSDWMEMVVAALALDQDALWVSALQDLSVHDESSGKDSAFMYGAGSSGSGSGPSGMVGSGGSSSSSSGANAGENNAGSPTSPYPASSSNSQDARYLHGPPIIALFLDLTTNMGNILYNAGHIQESITFHSNCLRLCEIVLEGFPLDAEFRMSFPLSIPNRFGTTMAGGLQSTPVTLPGQRTTNNTDPNMPAPPLNRRLHLSFLHRTILVAQARSLTHLSVCCQAMGLDDAALQCNSHAYEIVTFYRRFGVIGGVLPGTEVSRREDGGMVRRGSKRLKREEQTRFQDVQMQKTDFFAKESVEPLQASILGNMACSFYAKGRFASSMEHLVRSSTLFQKLNYNLACQRVLGSIHALKIDLGRSLKGLHWIRNMETQATGPTEIDECCRYWGPPRIHGINVDPSSADPDTFASASIGASWIMPGLKGLKECLKTFKEKDDLFGVLVTLVNMATGYIINGHPYIALYILGGMLTEQTASGLSLLKIDHSDGNSTTAKMPEALKLHTHFTLCQAVFLVLRLQNGPNEELFPRFIDIDPDTLLCCYSEPITQLVEAMDLQLQNFLDLDMLCVGFVTAVQDLEKTREEFMGDIAYAMLHISYVGEGGYFGASARYMNTLAGSSQSGSSADGSQITYGSHVFGIGAGVDFYTQQSILIRILMGKNDWLNASNIYRFESRGRSILYYTQGAQKLDTTVKDALELFRTGTGEKTNANNGLISNLHESTISALLIPPMSGDSYGGDMYAEPPGIDEEPVNPGPNVPPTSKFTAAMQSSMFTAPTLFAISGDIMAYGAFQMSVQRSRNQYAGDGIAADLLSVLRIPSTPTPARIHRDLLAAGAAAYSGGFGMCESCMRDMLRDPDAYGEMVFVSSEGAIVGASVHGEEVVFGGAAEPGNSVLVTRGLVDLKGRYMFPCRHYFV